MFDKICNFLNENYDVAKDDITLESELVGNLGLTSFQLVEMCSQLEEEFSIEIDEEKLPGIITVKDMIDVIQGYLDI